MAFVDVSAKQALLDAFEGFDALARASGSTAMLGVGVAPGMTNLLGVWAASGRESTAARVSMVSARREQGRTSTGAYPTSICPLHVAAHYSPGGLIRWH
ncbi:hypothetical protein JGU66_00040 [Myxococcaceae bacterium JPH2]|nr:hypothetical protein [Myxococcaceae bacterium JPH2]